MERPRLITPPTQADGVIRIGEVAEITDDEAGHIWRLLQLLDGTRSLLQVAEAMQAHDPSVIAEDVAVAIMVLAEAGCLEDAGA